ncbi:UTRA domain-containing protein [Lactiplantibacillus mudanjiangensis]|uniref:GntR family transcriptional regulator [Lactobacillus sp.] n=1 Tax=Lactiplantibacillus mudanjiangensis TaxID=1296538 RepID=A0A660ECQ6_9LACO|nr:UTRA domain-containing protein [Lactiplantibacillus mudanjiangensis]VDG23819.1 GntR family transcriptional regulator [Lactobacillus sp.] [Lactiplantibacillus mudanjiangensis]VDG30361.1 GntR family transcriptional regulator [Lactobacillus sp.] [Lactiplantibacillus mudanjiangensis]
MVEKTFESIYTTLKDRILAGKYSIKMRLPIEDDLIAEFEASRYAVRKAIRQLADDGLVYSVKGRGVVLLEHTPQTQKFNLNLGQLAGIKALNTDKTLDYRTDVVSFTQEIVDADLSTKTAFEIGIPVYAIKRVRLFNGKRAVIDINYFNAQLTPGINAEIARKSIYHYLQHDLKIKIAVVKRMLRVDSAEMVDLKYLDLGQNNCVGNMISIAFNDTGRQFEYTESHFIPNEFVFNQLIRN